MQAENGHDVPLSSSFKLTPGFMGSPHVQPESHTDVPLSSSLKLPPAFERLELPEVSVEPPTPEPQKESEDYVKTDAPSIAPGIARMITSTIFYARD